MRLDISIEIDPQVWNETWPREEPSGMVVTTLNTIDHALSTSGTPGAQRVTDEKAR